MRLLILTICLLTHLYSTSAFYCPEFLKGESNCSCDEYIDGAIVKCRGKEGPLVVERLKNSSAQVRELWLEHAKIIQVSNTI